MLELKQELDKVMKFQFFDPMVSKLIVHANNRQDAISRMHRALLDYKFVGLKNNITFLMKILDAIY